MFRRISNRSWARKAFSVYLSLGWFAGAALGSSFYRLLGQEHQKVDQPARSLIALGFAVSGPFSVPASLLWGSFQANTENELMPASDDFVSQRVDLYKAIRAGDLETIKTILREHPDYFKKERDHLRSVRSQSEERSALEVLFSNDDNASEVVRLAMARVMVSYSATANVACLELALWEDDEKLYRLLAKHVEYPKTTKSHIGTIDELQRTLDSTHSKSGGFCFELLARNRKMELSQHFSRVELFQQLEKAENDKQALKTVVEKDFSRDCRASYASATPSCYFPQSSQPCDSLPAKLRYLDKELFHAEDLRICATSFSLFGRNFTRCVEKKGPMPGETAAEIIDAALKTPCKK